MAACKLCKGPIPPRTPHVVGRNRHYCGASCQKKAEHYRAQGRKLAVPVDIIAELNRRE